MYKSIVLICFVLMFGMTGCITTDNNSKNTPNQSTTITNQPSYPFYTPWWVK